MLLQRRRSCTGLWILSSWLPEVLMRGRSLPGPAVILRRFSNAANGSRPAAGERAFGGYRIRLNQRSDNDAEMSASTAAAAANNAVISVSFCSKKSFALRFL